MGRHGESTDRDRRGFLRKIGAVGGATLAGLAAAGVGETQPRGKPRMRPGGVSAKKSGLADSPDLCRPPPATSDPVPLASLASSTGKGIRPASRKEILGMLDGKNPFPRELQPASDGDGPTPPSGILAHMIRLHSLASAYAAGITLTPTGVDYSDGTYRGDPPLSYHTKHARMVPDVLDQRRLWISETLTETTHVSPIVIHIQSLGEPTDTLGYTLELHVAAPSPSSIYDRYPPDVFAERRAPGVRADQERESTGDGRHGRLR